MFNPSKWKNQRTKAVFQMQFQATQVPQLKGKKKGLMLSLVPEDVGKPTVRLEKAAVVEGTCIWESPIYETVKLIKHQKTGKYKEKIYYFNVANGSSKSGFIGEVGVDFADFAEATEPFQVSLPLTTSDSGAILHVFIQKMQGTDDLREVEENESPQSESLALRNQGSDCSENGNILDFSEEHPSAKRNSVPLNKRNDAFPAENRTSQRLSTDWSLGSASDRSIGDILNSPEDKNHTERPLEASKNTVEMLRSEVHRLGKQAEVSELELQSLRRQIAKETKRGQDLSRQIVDLREEKDALLTECEHLTSLQKSFEATRNQSKPKFEDLRIRLEEISQELKHEKDLNRTLRLQLQNTEQSNSELVLAVEDLDKTIKQKNKEISNLSNKLEENRIFKEAAAESLQHRRGCEEEEKEKEDSATKQMIKDLYAEIELYKKDKEDLRIHMERLSLDHELSQEENYDLCSKLEQTQKEQMKMQSEYSKSMAAIREYELHVERLEEKIKKQAIDFSQSLDTIEELETHLKSLEKELETQEHKLQDDLEALIKAKVDEEQRAIQAEEALRKTRLTNATAAEHLQEELKRLSVQMTSKIDENEKLKSEAVAEAQNLFQQIRNLQEALTKSHEELSLTKDLYEQKLQKLSDQTNQQEERLKKMSLELHEKPQDWTREREELEMEFASLRKKAEKLQVESTTWKVLADEKKVMIGNLQLELKKLKADYNEVKDNLFVMELEKDKLRKEVSRLEHNLRKQEEAMSSVDPQKHLNLPKERKVAHEASITASKHDPQDPMEINNTKCTMDESRSVFVQATSNRGSCSGEEQTVLTSCYNNEHNLEKLLRELSSLDERNKCMESELKEMQEKYSEISLRFAEVEGERQQLVMTVRNLRNGKKT